MPHFIPNGTRVTLNTYPFNLKPEPTHRVCGRDSSTGYVRITPLRGGGTPSLVAAHKLITKF